MAGRNQVTLTFAGDSTQLERTFRSVGTAARRVGTDTSSAIDRIGTASTRAGRTAKGLQGALGGLVASGQGVRAMMEGDILGGLLMLEGGFGRTALSAAKLAKNIAATAVQFVVSAAKMVASMAATVATTVAGWVLMGVQAMINAAKMAVAWLISLGPIGLVIAAVGAVIAILVALGVGFDDLKRWAETAWNFILAAAQGVWNWLSEHWPLLLAILTGPFGVAALLIARNWETIKSGATAVKDWIVAKFGEVVDFFESLPGVVTAAFSSVGSSIVNGIKSLWNSTVGGFGFTVPSWVPGVGGRGFHIPELHTGGIVPGLPGTETLALLQAGERVTPAGRGGGGGITVIVQGSVLSNRELVGVIADAARNGAFRGLI